MSNPLEDLGLNLGITEEQAANETTAKKAGEAASVPSAPVVETKAKAAPRVEVEVGEIEIATEALESLPALTRGGATGSKYPFDGLVAPVADGDDWKYSSFKVTLQPGVDEDALKRSVQSATTQANSKGKTDGKKFVTRSVNEGGKFVAVKVFRVDGTLGDGE
jgi:hypothetical protein